MICRRTNIIKLHDKLKKPSLRLRDEGEIFSTINKAEHKLKHQPQSGNEDEMMISYTNLLHL